MIKLIQIMYIIFDILKTNILKVVNTFVLIKILICKDYKKASYKINKNNKIKFFFEF